MNDYFVKKTFVTVKSLSTTMYIQALVFLLFAGFSDCLLDRQTKCSMNLKASKIPSEMMELTQLPLDYSCPGEFDPKTFTECCNNGQCCEPALLTMPDNNSVLMVTAIIVISTCLILTVLSVVCCFWSKCPLYNTCRPSYTTNNIIVYSLGKDDPTPLMPAEGTKGGQYKPLTVKIKKMQEV